MGHANTPPPSLYSPRQWGRLPSVPQVARRFPPAIGWPRGRRHLGVACELGGSGTCGSSGDAGRSRRPARSAPPHPARASADADSTLAPGSQTPSAVHRGDALYIKRDDLTCSGLAFGGNKTRHALEFTFADNPAIGRRHRGRGRLHPVQLVPADHGGGVQTWPRGLAGADSRRQGAPGAGKSAARPPDGR